MLCVPAAKDEVVKVAWPLVATAPVPMALAPSRKVTVPVGATPFGGQPAPGQTVAVIVTDWPTFTAASGDRVVVVPALLTT